MKSVLLLKDQRAGRFPDRCVLTGEPAETAVNVWALESPKAGWIVGTLGYVGVVLAKLAGRGAMRVALPISERRWGIWKRRANLYAVTTAAGFGFALAGFVRPAIGLVVFGVLVVLASGALRMRALFNFWFATELRPEPGHVLVEPTHPKFDQQARKLFQRSS